MALLNSTWSSILVTFISIYLLYWYRSWSRLKHIPGPPLWGWTVLPLFLAHARGQLYDVSAELSKKYGPIVRIAPNTVMTSDPDELRKMNAPRSPYTRAPWYVAFRFTPGAENIFAARDEVDHAERRRKMAAAYSGKENVSLESDIDDCVRDLVNLVEEKYINSPPKVGIQMDIARKFQFFTTDVITKLSFDDNFHDLRDDRDNYGYITEVETIFPNLFAICVIPSFVYFLTSIGLLQRLGPSPKDKAGFGKVLAIAQRQVAKRFGAEGKAYQDKSDMLGSFIRHGVSQSQAEQETIVQLAAGSDTTATSLRSIMLCVLANPRIYARLRAEVDRAVAGGRAGSGRESIVPDEQARTLPYLQACIKEGIRWFVPVGGLFGKFTPPEGDTMCGHFLPGNVTVGQSVYAIHHAPALFGPDEAVFRPERWIPISEGGDEPSIEKIKAMERNNDLVFGHGRFQCLGKSVAAIELNKVVFELMRRFDISLVNPLEPWTSICYGIHLQKNMWVTVRRRSEERS